MLLLVNNFVQKMCRRVTNTISLYKLTNVHLLSICFKLVMKFMKFRKKLKINLKQINNKTTLVNLYGDIVLMTRLRIICKTLFTNNNIKVVIQMHSFLFDL